MLSAIEVNILALIMCGGIYHRIKKYKLEVIGTKRFLEMFFIMVVVLGAEVVTLVMESGLIHYNFYWFHMLVLAFYFLGQAALAYILLLFNFELQGRELSNKLKCICAVPIVLLMMALIINIIRPFAYTCGDKNEYYRLNGYIWIICSAFLYIFVDAVVAFAGHLRDKSSKVKRYCLIFNISIIIEGIISFAVYGIELFPMIAISLLLLFLSISDKRNTEIDEEASIDALTRLGNAKAYQKKIAELEEYENKKRTGNYAVVVMDINNLKITNDQYGHEIGNKLIMSAAECIAECFKNCDAFRIGGDEFVAILEDGSFDNRNNIFNSFIEKAEEYYIPISKGRIELQIAVGMAEYISDKNLSYIETFRMADKAMYENKYKLKNK